MSLLGSNDLPDYYVGVKQEYLLSRQKEAPVIASQLESKLPDNHETSTNDMTRKDKRKFVADKRKDERLCPTLQTNEVCPYGDNCKYNHAVATYLKNKPADINSNNCPNYQAYGYCSYGLMCRFGSCHINYESGINLGVPNNLRIPLNSLSKDVQNQLRKRIYKSNSYKPRNDQSGGSAVSEEREDKADNTLSNKKLIDFSQQKVYIAPLTTVGMFQLLCLILE